MFAGMAQIEITPPAGTIMSGYGARTNVAQGTHDPLYARVLVLSDDGQQVALIECDTVGFGLEYTRQAKAAIAHATGIPAAQIMLAATHTHSGPASVWLQNMPPDIDWLRSLPAQLSAAVLQARATLSPVELAFGTLPVAEVAYNRNLKGGPVDEGLHVLTVRHIGGGLKAVLLHFACHAVVLTHDNCELSADYPGALCRRIEQRLGVPSLFWQGCCGDIDPLPRGSFDAVEQVAERLADAAVALITQSEGLEPLSGTSLAVRSDLVTLPLGPLPAFDALVDYRDEQKALLLAAEQENRPADVLVARAMQTWAERTLAAYCSGMIQDQVTCEIQGIALGPLRLIAIPGELFVEFGLEAERHAQEQGKHALLITYANGDVGYIATPSAIARGGYEVGSAYQWYGYPAPLTGEASAQVRTAVERNIAF